MSNDKNNQQLAGKIINDIVLDKKASYESWQLFQDEFKRLELEEVSLQHRINLLIEDLQKVLVLQDRLNYLTETLQKVNATKKKLAETLLANIEV